MKKEIIKKLRIFFCVVALFLVLVFLIHMFRSSSFAQELCLFWGSSETENNLSINCNKIGKCCFIANYRWDGNEDTKVIKVPDIFDNLPVTRLGGCHGRGVPTPFMIELPDKYLSIDDEDYEGIYASPPEEFNIKDPYSVEEIQFTLNIGKNVNKIDFVEMDTYYPQKQENGSVIFYHPTVYVNCDKDNPYFYSKMGKLYEKGSDLLITEFAYG